MNTILFYVLILFLFLLLFLAITKITVRIQYCHTADDDLLEVKVSAWKYLKYTFSAPLIKIDENSPTLVVEKEKHLGNKDDKKRVQLSVKEILHNIQLFQDFLQHVIGFYRILRWLLKRIHLKKLEWSSHLGLGDAAQTGMLLSMVWTLKGMVAGLFGNYMRMHSMPKLSITPHYQELISETRFSCMFSFRLGYAIGASILVVKHWKGRPSFRTFQKEKNVTS
ncbi:DUF2953 domain-containing protein [Halalkalibacterium ligniniphilum]|uniref:DUF2953 domain-containing protein n=1 Tax=Halalkalibacterium ligniniphilum TaxID=1134413 RepID=UPI00034A8205|nr:DUF2953 domain-containing protein [Halalkalibacterium ligniniphilum]